MKRILGIFAFLVAMFASVAFGQDSVNPALRPPKGAPIAIVVFEDLQCPQCRRQAPVVAQAAKTYKIPVVRHDFPLPMHNWSFQAAVNARFFDSKNIKLGNDYRDSVFANQNSIETPVQLQQFTQKFAASHGVALPFAVDPMGKFTALVKADYALGQRIGIEHTPTIWIVTNGSHAAPFVEVVDRSKLYQLIDTALAETRGK